LVPGLKLCLKNFTSGTRAVQKDKDQCSDVLKEYLDHILSANKEEKTKGSWTTWQMQARFTGDSDALSSLD
jgi:hypothetical protein